MSSETGETGGWVRLCMAVMLAAGIWCALAGPVWAQYTDEQAIKDLGGPKAFAQRRMAVMGQMKAGMAVLFARPGLPEAAHYREDNDFYYLTGVADPGAALVMDSEKGWAILFEPHQSENEKKYLGANLLSMTKQEQTAAGFPVVMPLDQMDTILTWTLSGMAQPQLWVRLGFPDKADGARQETGTAHGELFNHPYYADVTPLDQEPTKLLRQRYPMADFRDMTPLLDAMRNIKTAEEIEVLRRNGKLSAEGDRLAMAHAHAGMHQYEMEATATGYFFSQGAQGLAYPAIVGSGGDINKWHYFNNRHVIEENQLVVFDFAASLDQETMDITRTFNVSGKFTPEQRKWYQVDLDAQKAVIAMLTPGHTYEEASAAGKAIYEKAGIGDQWWNSWPGHFVGLATHDVMSVTGPVKPGQVVTVEPIVEFREKQMHFRVEDTVLITRGAPEVLSAGVPKETDDVEKLVGSGK